MQEGVCGFTHLAAPFPRPGVATLPPTGWVTSVLWASDLVEDDPFEAAVDSPGEWSSAVYLQSASALRLTKGSDPTDPLVRWVSLKKCLDLNVEMIGESAGESWLPQSGTELWIPVLETTFTQLWVEWEKVELMVLFKGHPKSATNPTSNEITTEGSSALLIYCSQGRRPYWALPLDPGWRSRSS